MGLTKSVGCLGFTFTNLTLAFGWKDKAVKLKDQTNDAEMNVAYETSTFF